MSEKHSNTIPPGCSSQQEKRGFNLVGNKLIAWALIVISVVCLGFGYQSSHVVYADKNLVDAGLLQVSQEISEIELIEDSTFSGVESYKGELISIYDRSQPKTKQACPT